VFTATPEQTDAIKINAEAFMTLSKIAFSSIERLAALNLNVARTALEDSNAMLQVKDITELQNVRSTMTGTATQNAAAYLQNVQAIAAETQKEVTKLMASYFTPLAGGTKTSAGWTNGFEMFKGFANQLTAMTEANSKAVSKATAHLVTPVGSQSKKAA
jgi:hypothetical protein